jgi:3,4-dihydroxy-2-butanone 4-phosphate synthase
MAWMVRHTSGLVCAALEGDRLDALHLPPMVPANKDNFSTAFTGAVDAACASDVGLTAADRALTVRMLADPATKAEHFRKPGHMYVSALQYFTLFHTCFIS